MAEQLKYESLFERLENARKTIDIDVDGVIDDGQVEYSQDQPWFGPLNLGTFVGGDHEYSVKVDHARYEARSVFGDRLLIPSLILQNRVLVVQRLGEDDTSQSGHPIAYWEDLTKIPGTAVTALVDYVEIKAAEARAVQARARLANV